MDAAASLTATLLAALALSAPSSALQEDLPTPVHSVEGITEYQLDNGLRVLLFPDDSKQKVTVNVTYMVGSRHEGRGETGMAHLLEHMVFKGTDSIENIWGALEDHGARFNGTTWLDRTNYFETLPATEENLDFALRMEADRMVNSRIAEEDLAKEFSVVRNEFEMGENSPVGVLMERITSAAFLWHNYGKSTIGNRSDIERVPAANLRRFYQRYYQPDNALLVVAGRFDVEDTLAKVVRYFGSIPKPTRVLEETWTEEPVQDGARFVTLERVGSNRAAGAVYHVCAGPHEDSAALQVLDHVLTSRPSGRVYEGLVEAGLATGVFSMAFGTAEPGIFLVMAQMREDQDEMAAHDRLLEIVEGCAANPITEEEVERAKASLLKGIKLSLTDSGRIGIELSEWQAQGDWRLFFVNRDRLEQVTVEHVQRVAEHYFVRSNRTSGVFRPTAEPRRAEIPATPSVAGLVDGYVGRAAVAAGEAFEPTPENIERRTVRDQQDGMKLAFLPKETRGDAVTASFRFHYGNEASMKAHLAALEMLPQLLMRGTQRLDYQALRDEFDRLQSRISVGGGPGQISASITSDRANLAAAIRLLGEILRSPALPEKEFDVLREQRLSSLEESLTDPQALLFTQLQRLLRPFPKDHFHYVPTLDEELARTQAVSLEEVRELHQELLGAGHAEVCIVGDFDPAVIKPVLAETFGGWRSSVAYARVPEPHVEPQAKDETIHTPDKKMAVVARGTSFPLRDDHPDYAVLEFANYVLGQSAKSRLLTRLRHEGGLSYGAGSMLQASSDDDNAGMIGYAICAPENADEAQRAMQEEFRKWIEAGLSPEELQEGKLGWRQQFEGNLANDGYVAGVLLDGLEHGRTFAFEARNMERVQALGLDDVKGVLEKHLSEASFVDVKAGDLAEN